MAKPFLLVETPRAGHLNHRFICSPAADITDEAASDLCGGVRLKAGETQKAVVGDDYVAVIRRGVFQVKSDRRGDEILILGGINPRRVNTAAALAALSARLPAVGDLAAAVADRPGILVEHDDLRLWLAEALAAGGAGAAGGVGLPWGKIGVAVALLAVLAGGAYFASTLFSRKSDNPPSNVPGSSTPGGDQQKTDSPRKADPTPDDLARELGLATDPAARAELANRLKGQEAKLPVLVEQAKTKKIDPYALFKDAKEAGMGLPELASRGKTLTSAQAIELRVALRLWRKHLVELRTAAIAAKLHEPAPLPVTQTPTRRPPEPVQPVATPTLDLLAALAAGQEFAVSGDAAEPRSPYLDTADAATADELRKLFVGSRAGRAFAVNRLMLADPPTDLAVFLAAFHENAIAIDETFRKELRDAARLDDPSAKLHTALKSLLKDLRPGGPLAHPQKPAGSPAP